MGDSKGTVKQHACLRRLGQGAPQAKCLDVQHTTDFSGVCDGRPNTAGGEGQGSVRRGERGGLGRKSLCKNGPTKFSLL